MGTRHGGGSPCRTSYNFTHMAETEITFSDRDSHEGGYEGRALGHSIFTQAKTMDELIMNVEDAMRVIFLTGNEGAYLRG